MRYNAENFEKIFTSKVMVPAAVCKIEPENPKSDTILVYYMKEAMKEYEIANEIEGI